MFGTVEDNGEIFKDSVVQTRGKSLSSTQKIGTPVAYKLVRLTGDGRLVPATDEEMLKVKELLENNENDTPMLPDPIQTEEYIPDVESPSRFLQLESLEGLFQSETAEAYTENLNARLEISNELCGNEQQVQTDVLLQKSDNFLSNGCNMNQSMDASPCSNVTGSPKEPALSTGASKPESSKAAGEICLKNLSVKALQEIYRGTFGRETTCKDKQWLKRRITMGLSNSCVVPATSVTVIDNKLIGEGLHNNYMIDASSKDTVDEERATNCKDTPSSPLEISVDHYSGNEDFEGEHRSAKRARKPTRRYIEEISKTDGKQQTDESMIPSEDQKSVQALSPKGKVVVTRIVSLGGSKIQVPYVSHVRRSRPRENIMALGEFRSCSWKVNDTSEESNLNLSPTQLSNDVNQVSDVKSASRPVKKESNKDKIKPIFTEVDQDIMETEQLDSSGDISDDNNDNCSDLPITPSAIRRKHHRAWTLSEVVKLVEGVSIYGVGKWSEIKRRSFSSHAYRTPVDLKDKWRNLRRASFAQTSSNRMESLKKHGSMAIPNHIMLQVRELSQKQPLVSMVSKARVVKKSRSTNV